MRTIVIASLNPYSCLSLYLCCNWASHIFSVFLQIHSGHISIRELHSLDPSFIHQSTCHNFRMWTFHGQDVVLSNFTSLVASRIHGTRTSKCLLNKWKKSCYAETEYQVTKFKVCRSFSPQLAGWHCRGASQRRNNSCVQKLEKAVTLFLLYALGWVALIPGWVFPMPTSKTIPNQSVD